MPNQRWLPDQPGILDILASATVAGRAMLAAGSNYVFLLQLSHPEAGEGYAVYKPQRGEAPLSDFPEGTLYKREYAAYVVSEALRWGLVPPTVIRGDGLEMGVGMVQLFVEHDPAQNYFTLRDEHAAEMQRIAVFDWLTNNADRKGGHCLLDEDHRIWGIDHGLCFHPDYKMRTVMWDWAGETIPPEWLTELDDAVEAIETGAEVAQTFLAILEGQELAALVRRARRLVSSGQFPLPGPHRSYPWPLV